MKLYFYLKSIFYMKSKLTCLLICFLILACNNNNSLSFEPLTIATDSCENCTSVRIEIPEATGKTKLSKTINSALEGEIIALLNFDEESDAQNLEEAKEAFVYEGPMLILTQFMTIKNYPENSLKNLCLGRLQSKAQ